MDEFTEITEETMLDPYHVYVQTDGQGRITAVNSSAFVSEGWGTEIDQGYGDQYHHAQGNYFSQPIYTEDGIPRYKLEDGQAVERTEEEIEADRAAMPGPAPDITPQLRVVAMAFAATATTIPDAQALEMPDLFPAWETVLAEDKELAAERVISKDGQLYRVVQAVTPQEHQPPDGEGMLAIYRPINPEHAGTADDPIPWVYGMDCHAGKYYSYEGAVYTVAEGGDMIPCTWPPDSDIWQWVKVTV